MPLPRASPAAKGLYLPKFNGVTRGLLTQRRLRSRIETILVKLFFTPRALGFLTGFLSFGAAVSESIGLGFCGGVLTHPGFAGPPQIDDLSHIKPAYMLRNAALSRILEAHLEKVQPVRSKQ